MGDWEAGIEYLEVSDPLPFREQASTLSDSEAT